MLTNSSLIERQIGILRDILSEFSLRYTNEDVDFISLTNKYFYFDTEKGWNILMNAFYVFEDTEMAKEDFDQFGLQGPSRHENLGEKYLRLYGILNSLYMQYLAVINLMELFKLEPRKTYLESLKINPAIQLRNKIASHPSNHMADLDNSKSDVYEISRPNLAKEEIVLMKNQEEFENYDLKKALHGFNNQIEEIIGKIIGKFIKKKFQNQGKHFHEYQKLEKIRSGAIEFGSLIIEFKENDESILKD